MTTFYVYIYTCVCLCVCVCIIQVIYTLHAITASIPPAAPSVCPVCVCE